MGSFWEVGNTTSREVVAVAHLAEMPRLVQPHVQATNSRVGRCPGESRAVDNEEGDDVEGKCEQRGLGHGGGACGSKMRVVWGGGGVVGWTNDHGTLDGLKLPKRINLRGYLSQPL